MRLVAVLLLLVAGTVVIQVLAQSALIWLAHRLPARPPAVPSALHLTTHLVPTVLILMIGHLLQVTLWALYYHLAWDGLDGFGTAFYYSLANFTTAGAADVTPPHPQRLVGVLEAAAGMLMFGWSTALLVRAVQKADRTETP